MIGHAKVLSGFRYVILSDLLSDQSSNGSLQAKRNLEKEISQRTQNDLSCLFFNSEKASHQNNEFKSPPLCYDQTRTWQTVR